ncbi:MAG: ribonuclease III [Proteobacteria bacterium]|jgi:ribonuclease-3|nr:ribonuclease III [Pseudomonadota bacterium]
MVYDASRLQKDLGYTFKDSSMLKRALTHRSYSKTNNERLEFVGDGILDYAIALSLYNKYPFLAEGVLSKIRAALVNQDSLSMIATQINLGEYLFIGDGEEKSGGRLRPSILADALEAIFAAVSLDSNIQQAMLVIDNLFKDKFIHAEDLIDKDSKSILQEYLQASQISPPVYNIIALDGPDHDSVFHVECVIAELNINITACGKSKKEASQFSAQKALKLIKERKINGNSK